MPVPPVADPPPPALPDPGWTECWPFPALGTGSSFVSAGPTGGRLRVAYFTRLSDGGLVGRAWFGPETEGPPGFAHGGSIASVLDEALGAAAWHAGYPVVVASLHVDFRQLVPLGMDTTFEAAVDHVDRRKVHTKARLVGPGGDVLAEGRALCVMLRDDQVAQMRARTASAPGSPVAGSNPAPPTA